MMNPRLHCISILIVLTLLALPVPVAAAKAQVMILGVSHLVAKRDVYNSAFQDSPLSSKRQTEIDDVVTHLVRFHPTKVLVEAKYRDPKWAQRYRKYLSGEFTLGANEVYQFGFKLAARARDSSIYPVDTFGPSVYDDASPSGKRIDAFLKVNFTKLKDPEFEQFLARSNTLQTTGTYLELLRYLNTDAAVRANASWYSLFDGWGESADNAGAAYVAQWYARNAYIFANILNTIKAGDRVVVIMGQGHKYLLDQFLRLNPNLIRVDALDYLR